MGKSFGAPRSKHEAHPTMDPACDPTVLLFYAYVEPQLAEAEVEAMLRWQEETCARLSLEGRMRVSAEVSGEGARAARPVHGRRTTFPSTRHRRPPPTHQPTNPPPQGLNGNLTGAAADVDAYCKALAAYEGRDLSATDFKLAPTSAAACFRGLKVWRTKEVVALGAEPPAGAELPDGDTQAARGGDVDPAPSTTDAQEGAASQAARLAAPAPRASEPSDGWRPVRAAEASPCPPTHRMP